MQETKHKLKKTITAILIYSAIFNYCLINPADCQSLREKADSRTKSASDLNFEISIPSLIDYAYKHNTDILGAKEAWKATIEKYQVITSYPDPQLSVTYFPEPIETRLGPQDWNASVTQMIPFPGKLTKAGEIVEVDALIAKLNLDRVVRDVAKSIIQSYHELLYIQKARKIAQFNANILDELRKFGESAHAQDQSTFLDVVKSQSQVAQISYDIILLDELEMTEKTKLNGLLNRPPDALLGSAKDVELQEVVYTPDELYKLAKTNREEIQTADAEIKKAEVQMELAGYENLPEFRVGFFYAGVGDPDVASPPKDAGEDSYGVQFGMNIPIWFDKNISRKEGAKAKAQQARAKRTSQVNQTYTQVKTLYFKLINAKRLMTLYRDNLIPQAIESVQKSETWYRGGEGSFSDFVETQKVAYDFQLALARAGADYGKTLAALEQVVGKSITERPVAQGPANSPKQ